MKRFEKSVELFSGGEYVSPEMEVIIIDLEQSVLAGGSTDPWEDGN